MNFDKLKHFITENITVLYESSGTYDLSFEDDRMIMTNKQPDTEVRRRYYCHECNFIFESPTYHDVDFSIILDHIRQYHPQEVFEE